jgi:hypothetical protein
MNAAEVHLHHMARRHHATMKKLDGLREKFTAHAGWLIGTVEVGAGAWLGGAIEGKSSGGTLLNIPYNLGIGAVLLTVGHLGLAGGLSDHLNHLGNGLVSSFAAASGYAFGKRWKDTGAMFGGGGHPWIHPYEQGGQGGWQQAPAAAVHGDLSEAQMAHVVQRMQHAANAPAHP